MPINKAMEKVSIPKKYNATERRAIASDIIEYIRKRTQNGKGKGNKEWSGPAGRYSDSYKKSLEYKLKAKKTPVNLTLSGDMLTAIELRKHSPGELQIGIPTSSEEWGRAKGNILGSYGQKTANPSKARPFLSLDSSEVKKILKKYPTSGEKREEKIEELKKAEKILKEGLILGKNI